MEATFTSQADERQKNTKSQRDREGVTEKTVTDRLTDIKIAFHHQFPFSSERRRSTCTARVLKSRSLRQAFDSCLDV